MKNSTVILLILLSVISNGFAFKSKIDSLENKLKTDTVNRISLLNEISYSYWNNDPEKCYNYAIEALVEAKKTNNTRELAYAYNNLGLVNYSWGHYKLSLNYHFRALKILKQIKDYQGQAYSYNNIAFVYNQTGDFDEAMDNFRHSLYLKDSLGDKKGYSNTLNHIGDVFANIGKMDNALDYYRQSLALKEKINHKRGIGYSYSSIAGVYRSKLMLDSAIYYEKKALNIFKEEKHNYGIFLSYKGLGENAFLGEKYSNALNYYYDALSIQQNLNNKVGKVQILSKIGITYAKMKDYKAAIEFLLESINLSISINTKKETLLNYKELANVYAKAGNYKKAYEYFQLYTGLKDEVFSKENNQRLTEILADIGYTRKENELLKQQREFTLLEMKRQKLVRNFAISIIFFLVVLATLMAIFYFKSRKLNKQLFKEIDQRKQTEEDLKKAKEKAEESDTLKSAFLANMSHEIRTPLNAILGFSSLLVEPDLTKEERQEFAGLVQTSGKSLLMLVNDIIDIAKIEAGQITIQTEACNLNELFEKLLPTFNEEKNRLEKFQIKLIKKTKDLVPVIMKTDPGRIQQIMTNLVGNAMKFTEKGSIEFGFDRHGKEVEFFVKDTGIGMNKEDVEMIFERFVKLDSDTTKLYRGTGLGLAITKSLVEILGGKIYVQSKKDKGSEFRFILPFTEAHDTIKKKKQVKIYDTDNVNWQSKHILIAENEKSNFDYLKKVLEKTRINITWAKNGKETLAYLDDKYQFELILMDIKMPEIDGITAMEEIRKDNQSIPIIAQTAQALAGEKEKYLKLGFNAYISKPIDKTELISLMGSFLEE